MAQKSKTEQSTRRRIWCASDQNAGGVFGRWKAYQ